MGKCDLPGRYRADAPEWISLLSVRQWRVADKIGSFPIPAMLRGDKYLECRFFHESMLQIR